MGKHCGCSKCKTDRNCGCFEPKKKSCECECEKDPCSCGCKCLKCLKKLIQACCKASGAGSIQTLFASTQNMPVPRTPQYTVLSLPIQTTSGILKILGTFSFASAEGSTAIAKFRIAIDDQVVISSDATSNDTDTPQGGAVSWVTKVQPLQPGTHVVSLVVDTVDSVAGILIGPLGGGHAALTVEEVTN